MDRRKFLRSALYFTVVSATLPLAACGGDDSTAAGAFAFPHGVASGDPKESSLVFWTRCVATAPGALNQSIPLRLEVSTSPAFTTVVVTVIVSALAQYDFTVRAKVITLVPGTPYFYRFSNGRDCSPIGEASTAPPAASKPARLRFAWINCQDWSTNHWGALELAAAEELDFVVHLGDYVYESVPARFEAGRAEPAHGAIVLPNGVARGDTICAESLEDYRTLYRTYRSDARLQELHRKFPMIAVWDDHEFSDDCWQDHETYTNENAQQTARRRSANQAWAEYMPIDFGDVSFDLANRVYDNIRIYRDFSFGTLMHLVMTDERLYRDDHVVSEAALARLLGHDPVGGDDALGSRALVPLALLREFEAIDTARRGGRAPSILGSAQSDWWKATLANSRATWKIWGNEVTLNRMWIDLRGAPKPLGQLYVLDADAWDGYPSHRADLMAFLKTQAIANVVAISGDLHAFQCGTIRDDPDPAVGTPVAVDFVAAGISSASLFQELREGAGARTLAALLGAPEVFDRLMRNDNPDLAYVEHDAQGYAVATVTADAFTVLFNKVRPLNADGSKPADPLAGRTRVTLAFGSTTPVIEQNV